MAAAGGANANTLSVVSEIDGKRCKLVIKSGLQNLTVANIKKHLAGPTGVPVQDQVLAFNGVVLQDYQTGEQIGLQPGSQLRLSAISHGAVPVSSTQPGDFHQTSVPQPPPGVPTQQTVAPQQRPPYYSPSESSLGGQTNQVSTVSKETSIAPPHGVPLQVPGVGVGRAHDPSLLQPDMRGRERQKEEELRSLQRRSGELEYDRTLHAQAGTGVRQTGPGQAVPLSPRHATTQQAPIQLSQGLPPPPPGLPQGLPQGIPHGHPTPGSALPPNPSRVDPSAAGYNDLQAAQERVALERQSMMQDQIDRERSRFDEMHSNMGGRIDRQERMIKGTKKERELEERVFMLEQENEALRIEAQAANERAGRELEASRHRIMELEAKSRAAEDVANARGAEIEGMQLRQRDLEGGLLEATQAAAKAQEVHLTANIAAVNNGASGLTLARQNLAEFGRDIGVGEQLDFDENLTCVVGLEQRYTILLTYDNTTERLYVYSTLLSYLPQDHAARLRLYEALLEGALLGREMCGGGVGLSMKNELLLMSTSIDLKHSDCSALRHVAPTFVDCLVKWRQLVKETLLESEHQHPPTSVNATPVTPSSYAAAAAMHSFAPPKQASSVGTRMGVGGDTARGPPQELPTPISGTTAQAPAPGLAMIGSQAEQDAASLFAIQQRQRRMTGETHINPIP